MALYMGPSSNFGYGNAPMQGGQPPRVPQQPQQPMNGGGASKTVTLPPPLPGSDAHIAQQQQNTLNAQAVRATGPSQGYDPAYLQNLATSIGGLFGNRGGTENINPLGDLSEISPKSGMEGNAPSNGLPLTLLQQALNGGGFASPVSAPPTGKPKPRPPIDRTGGGGRYGGRYLQ